MIVFMDQKYSEVYASVQLTHVTYYQFYLAIRAALTALYVLFFKLL